MVKNKRGLVEKGQHKVQKMYLVSEKLSDLPCSDYMKRLVSQQGQVQLITTQQDETHLKLYLSII
jgi:hypothetical protein